MTLPPQFGIRIEEISNDFTNGSTVIANNVLKLLLDSVNYIDDSNKIIILDLATELLTAKPHMAAPTNILNAFIELFPNFTEKAEIRNFLKGIESEMLIASETCVLITQDKLFKKEKTSVLTCSYSSNVYNILARVKSELFVYVFESIWKGINYSEIWEDKLNKMNIKSYRLTMGDKIPEIDFGLIGADAILNSVDVINGTPSLFLAQSLKKIGKSLFVVAESFKKCNKIKISDGFDLISNELITELITDHHSKPFEFV